MARFGHVITAMVTPFNEDGALDIEGAVWLAQWLINNGSDGLLICGTTGESSTLTQSEKVELVSAVVSAVEVPVIACAGGNDTRAAIDLTERMSGVGASAILHMAGYYNRPSQAGLDIHFRACADATHLPIILYDIPARTGRKIATETIAILAHEVNNIVAVKDASDRLDETTRLLSMVPDDFEVYSGNDWLTLPLLAVGAVGTMGVATHWAGVEVRNMIFAFQHGDFYTATSINRKLLSSYAFESTDAAPNPVPAKCMLRVMGMPSGPCRLPMGPEPKSLSEEAQKILKDLGRL